MIGYHYTTYKNWLGIKKQGLIPHLAHEDEIYNAIIYAGGKMTRDELKGVWLWQKEQSGIAHLGNLIHRMTAHQDTKAVVLKVKFNKKNLFSFICKNWRGHYCKNMITLTHQGMIGDWVYHKYEDKHEAYFVKKEISPMNIQLIHMWDFMKFAEDYEH